MQLLATRLCSIKNISITAGSSIGQCYSRGRIPIIIINQQVNEQDNFREWLYQMRKKEAMEEGISAEGAECRKGATRQGSGADPSRQRVQEVQRP